MSGNEKLIERIRAGENVKDNIAMLYFNNEGVTNIVLRKYPPELFEDLKQESFFVLLACIKHYRLDRPNKFTTYYARALKSLASRYKQRNSHNYISLDTTLKENENITLKELIPDTATNVEATAITNACKGYVWSVCLSKLTAKQYAVLVKKYIEGKNFKHIAKETGLTYSQVIASHKQSLIISRKVPELMEYNNYCYCRVSLNSFKQNNTSAVEKAVLKRENAREKAIESLLRCH